MISLIGLIRLISLIRQIRKKPGPAFLQLAPDPSATGKPTATQRPQRRQRPKRPGFAFPVDPIDPQTRRPAAPFFLAFP